MNGTLTGVFVAFMYYSAFQAGGLFFSFSFFQSQKLLTKILLGSVIGTFCLHWLPTITSFFMDFNQASHIVALVLFAALLLLANFTFLKDKSHVTWNEHIRQIKEEKDYLALFVVIPVCIYFMVVLIGHSFPLNEMGAMETGQCTFGDMNLHLAIITSIANQGIFPPDYSLLPGNRLAYPFLSDSISSSLYIWNSSLRFAYVFPMLIAALQLFIGFYLFAKEMLVGKIKAVVAWILFFFSGGLGFFYFLDMYGVDANNFTRIFTAFYETPTNYTVSNIRWVNIIVDMLIPQRATLFGWAILFPLLLLLRKSIIENSKKLFISSGILAAGLPMIHTHSFLSLGMICTVWLLYHLFSMSRKDMDSETPILEYVLLVGGLVLFSILQYINLIKGGIQPKIFLSIGISGIALFMVFFLYVAGKHWIRHVGRTVICNWGIFLAIVLLFALPQLFIWTFHQASGEGFIRGHLNWSNASDLYLWFYLKNIGLTAVFALAAFLSGKRRIFMIGAPAMFIWFVAELIEFQPNDYDNNKLLFVAFAFLCIIASDFIVDLYRKMKRTPWKYISSALLLFCLVFSAVLTMGREYVSNYELYNKNQVELSVYIEENTPAQSTILMDTRHNNAVAALTGRNLVCGTGTFLYFHGLDYANQEQAIHDMYSNPTGNRELFTKYNVDYIVVGPEERGSYPELDESVIASLFPLVYKIEDVSFYQVKNVN